MSNTQSIIIYRNPVEQAFWESGMIVPLGAGLATVVITVVVLSWLVDKLPYKWRRKLDRDWQGYGIFGAGIIAGVLVFNHLLI